MSQPRHVLQSRLGHLKKSVTVTIRRLHDVGKSGWYIFMGLIPLVGGILVLVKLASPSELRDNQYGPYDEFVV